jgi:hypothetical protein
MSTKTSGLSRAAIFFALLLIMMVYQLSHNFGIVILSSVAKKLDSATFLLIFLLSLLVVNHRFSQPLVVAFILFTSGLLLGLAGILDSDVTFLLAFGQLFIDLKILMAIYLGYRIGLDSDAIRLISRFLFVTLLAATFCSLIQIFMPESYGALFPGAFLETYIQGTEIRRLVGVFFHPSDLGVFAALSGIWFVGIKLAGLRFSYLNAGILIAVLLILFSGQRQELAGFIFALSLAFIYRYRGQKMAAVFLMAGVVLALILYGTWLPWLSELLISLTQEVNDADQVANPRLSLYRGAVYLAGQNFPLGVGLGGYGSSISLMGSGSAYFDSGISMLWWYELYDFLTDTYWAMIIAELGWVGSAMVLFSFLYLIVCSLKQWSQGSTDAATYVGPLVLVFALLTSITSPIFSANGFFIMLIGIPVGASFRVFSAVRKYQHV